MSFLFYSCVARAKKRWDMGNRDYRASQQWGGGGGGVYSFHEVAIGSTRAGSGNVEFSPHLPL